MTRSSERSRLYRLFTFALGAIATVVLVTVLTGAPAWAETPSPLVTGPITGGCSPDCPSPPGPTNGIHVPEAFGGNSNLAEFTSAGYVEEEYFFEGTARAFARDPAAAAWDSSGIWTSIPSTTIPPAAYKSRMLVRRPADPLKFNGIVIVEWLNVTASEDLAPDYGYFRAEVLRDGFIWVGVSAQAVGINGGTFTRGFGLKSYDPVRYGSLVHPGDNYCYDIFSQAAQAILNPGTGINPLGSDAYLIRGMLADGESQSAGRMVTYYNAIQPQAQLFDGFLVHSRGAGGGALFSGTGGTVPSPSRMRTDLAAPVLVFETETDTAGHFTARQSDGPTYRLWEPAGTAHVDLYDDSYFHLNSATQVPFYPLQGCVRPVNSAHERYIMNAALLRLSQWTHGGTPPPTAPPITVVNGLIQRDTNGIALGGIRLPEMDVPTVAQQGVGNLNDTVHFPQSTFCVLFGQAVPLPVEFKSLYRNHGSYVSQYAQAANALQAAGFLLPPDADEAKSEAAEAKVP
jgi:Alpha/beta hydrolase domain